MTQKRPPLLFLFCVLFFSLVPGSDCGPITFSNTLGARQPVIRQGGAFSGRFLSRVGGVAFMNVARPDKTLVGKPMVAGYDPSGTDGERLWVKVGATKALIRAPDWIGVAAIRFANTPFTAAYTITAPEGDGRQIHPELQNTQMGLIVYYVDHMLIDPMELRRDVMANDGVEGAPFISKFDEEKSSAAADRIEQAKFGDAIIPKWRSFLYLDKDVAMRFSINNGEVTFSGHPYVLFWYGEFDERSEEIIKWTEVKEPTRFFRENPLILHDLNPVVFQTAERFSQLVSFFRYLKKESPKNWSALTSAVKNVALPDPAEPSVAK